MGGGGATRRLAHRIAAAPSTPWTVMSLLVAPGTPSVRSPHCCNNLASFLGSGTGSVFVSRPTWPIRDGGPWAPARPSRPSLGAWAGVVPRAQARPLSGGVPLTLDEFEVDVAGDEAGTSFTPAIDRWGPSGMERQTDAEGVPWATGNPAVFSYDKLVAGELRYRYDRFLACVRLKDGSEVHVHCPNTGPMVGLVGTRADRRITLPTGDVKTVRAQVSEGAQVLMSDAGPASRRKCRFSLEWMRPAASREWVGVHSANANPIAHALLTRGLVPGLEDPTSVQREVPIKPGTRVDFQIVHKRGATAASTFLEVKSVTLAVEARDLVQRGGAEGSLGMRDESRVALFPDTVSDRALRHVQDLHEIVLHRRDSRGVVLFVIQRGDCEAFAPSWEHDPTYSAVLSRAVRAGMPALAARCRLTRDPTRAKEEGRGYQVEFSGLVPVDTSLGQCGSEEMAKIDKVLGRRLTAASKKRKGDEGADEEGLARAVARKKATGYNLFLKETRGIVKEQNPSFRWPDITKEVASRWRSMDAAERDAWNARAADIRSGGES